MFGEKPRHSLYSTLDNADIMRVSLNSTAEIWPPVHWAECVGVFVVVVVCFNKYILQIFHSPKYSYSLLATV